MNCTVCGKELYDLANGPFHSDIDAAIECYNRQFLVNLEPEPQFRVKPGMLQPGNWHKIISFGLVILLGIVVIVAIVVLTGCGALPQASILPHVAATSAAIPAPSEPIAKPAPALADPFHETTPALASSLVGAWEFRLTPSDTGPETLIEANLQQSDGGVSANSGDNQLMFLSVYAGADYVRGDRCNGFELGSAAGTISDDGFALAVSVTGNQIYTIQMVGTTDSNGGLTGTYTASTAGLSLCPFSTAGAFSGAKVQTRFTGTYAGVLAADGEIGSNMETIVITLAQGSGSVLSADGSNNSLAFGLSGFEIGSYFEMSNFVSGAGSEQSFSGYLVNSRMWIWDEVTGDSGFLVQN